MEFVLLAHVRNQPDNDNLPLAQWDAIAKFSAVSVDVAKTSAATTTKSYFVDHSKAITLLAQLHSRFGLMPMTLQQDDF